MPWSNAQFYSRGQPSGVSLGAPGVWGAPAGGDTHGAFGTNLDQIKIPDPHADLLSRIPTLDDETRKLFANIAAQTRGQLSPETLARIQDASAQFGVSSGMPGSGLARSRTVRDLGLSTEALQQQGLENFLKATNNVQQTQTLDPSKQFEFDLQNQVNLHAPNPTAAANVSKSLFDQYLANLRGPGGGTGNRSFPTSFQAPGATPGTPPAAPGAGGFQNPFVPPGGSTAARPIQNNTPFGLIQDAPPYSSPYPPIQDAPPYPLTPENWDLFSEEQQRNYPSQLAWARSVGNEYE